MVWKLFLEQCSSNNSGESGWTGGVEQDEW